MAAIDLETAPAIGIDLGTTYSAVAVLRHGKVEVIANELGCFTTPSYVAFTNAEQLIGDAAKDQAALNPSNTVYDAKRLIGRKFDDPVVQQDIEKWPFKVINCNSKPKIQIEYKDETKTFCAEEISAMILGKMKEIAESYLNQTVTNAVITVPAYFNNSQRQATRDAAQIAGLNVLRILNEPTAAAIAYKFQNKDVKYEAEKNILVYDLGGGTFDVSILKVKDRYCEVVATAGDTHLGGEDFDHRLVEHLQREFQRKHRNVPNNPRIIHRLRFAAEKAKRYLSSATQTTIEIDALYEGIDFSTEITRPRFDALNADMFKATLKPVEQALADAKLQKCEIDEIILVGGSTRIPKIQKLLFDFFDGRKDLNRTINPDEAVAYGAAVQAAILHGDYSVKIFGLILQDVTPLSLGIGSGRCCTRMEVVIPRNSGIPIKRNDNFCTLDSNQTRIRFPVYQGESSHAHENHFLGDFVLGNIPPKPAGVECAEVTFEIDSNGILTVNAVHESNRRNTSGITIENVSMNFTSQEISCMIENHRKYREEAQNRKEIRKIKFAIEDKCYEIKNALYDENKCFDGVILDPEREALERECDDTMEWLSSKQCEDKMEYESRFEKIIKLAGRLFKNFGKN